jgi:hypothetical protein
MRGDNVKELYLRHCGLGGHVLLLAGCGAVPQCERSAEQ